MADAKDKRKYLKLLHFQRHLPQPMRTVTPLTRPEGATQSREVLPVSFLQRSKALALNDTVTATPFLTFSGTRKVNMSLPQAICFPSAGAQPAVAASMMPYGGRRLQFGTRLKTERKARTRESAPHRFRH